MAGEKSLPIKHIGNGVIEIGPFDNRVDIYGMRSTKTTVIPVMVVIRSEVDDRGITLILPHKKTIYIPFPETRNPGGSSERREKMTKQWAQVYGEATRESLDHNEK